MITSEQVKEQFMTMAHTNKIPDFWVVDSRGVARDTDKAVGISNAPHGFIWIPKSVIERQDTVKNSAGETWPCLVVAGWWAKKNWAKW